MTSGNLLDIYHDHTLHGVYYSVGPARFINKLLALEHSRLTHVFPKFHYHDDVFGAQDWSQEPQQSWQDLLVQRARQIRERYDYVMLAWSGGTDSMTMWHAFRAADVHIDSILVVYADDDRYSALAYPKANVDWIKQNHWDADTEIIASERTDPRHFSEFREPGWIWQDTGLPNAARVDGGINKELHRALLEDRAQARSCCMVVGHEKPCVRLEGGKWYSSFLDVKAYNYFAGYQYFEPFFSTPDMPAIHIKQSHMVKRWAIQRMQQRGLYLDRWDSETDWYLLGDFDDQGRASGRSVEVTAGTSHEQKKILRSMNSSELVWTPSGFDLHGPDWFYLRPALQRGVQGAVNYAKGIAELVDHSEFFAWLKQQGWIQPGKSSVPWTTGIYTNTYLLGV